MNAQLALNAYRRTDVLSEVEAASPFRLVQIVLQRAIEQVHRAQAGADDVTTRRDATARAVGLIEVLRNGLVEDGSDMVRNLQDLYGFMIERLLAETASGDPRALETVGQLLATIKSAWDQIPERVRQQPELADGLKDRIHGI